MALPVVVFAEEITYTGDKNKLQEAPSWVSHEKNDNCFFPGTAAAPLSSGNRVTVNYNISALAVADIDLVFGGLSEAEDTSHNNVVLRRGHVAEGIFGGYSYNSNAEYNTATISGGSVGYGVLGGFSNNGSAVSNKVFLNGGTIGLDICGGGSFGDSAGAEVLDNVVTISGGSVAAIVVGGFGRGSVARNIVMISEGELQEVFGGVNKSFGSVTGNAITVSGGLINGDVFGGYNQKGITANNTVAVSGGSVCGRVTGGSSIHGDATNNTVTISGGNINGDVYGGASVNGDGTDNTITISGRANLTEVSIWGGYIENPIGDDFTGNTLELKTSDVSVMFIHNFEYYNFYLPKELAAGGVMLSVKKVVCFAGTTVKISLPDSTSLKKGDKIALIHSDGGVSGSPKNKICKVQQGGWLYEFSIRTDSNNLWAEVTKVSRAAK